MPISVGKNLKLVETDDNFVVDLQSNFEGAYNYIHEKYPDASVHTLKPVSLSPEDYATNIGYTTLYEDIDVDSQQHPVYDENLNRATYEGYDLYGLIFSNAYAVCYTTDGGQNWTFPSLIQTGSTSHYNTELPNRYIEIGGAGSISLYDALMSFASFSTLQYIGLPSGASFEWFLPTDRILTFNSNNANIVERCNYTQLSNGITVSATANYGRASFLFPVKKGCKYTVDFDSEVNGGYKMVYFGNRAFAPGEGWDPAYGTMQVGGHKSYTFTATSDVLWIGIYASADTSTGIITLTNIKLLENKASIVDVISGSLIPYVVTFSDTSKYISSIRANEDTVIDCTNMTSNTVILTINPDPIDATVVLEVEGGNPFDFEQVGNSITVSPGTSVRYTVSKTDYITQSNVIEVNETQTVEINLSETLYTYIIHPTPANATVSLTAAGYTQEDNSISVPRGTTVEWSVSKTNYIAQTGTKVVDDNCADNIILKKLIEFTITPTPSNATVTLIATGYSQVGNSIKVPYGTTVVWMVEKEGYLTKSGSKIMTEDTEAQIILEEMMTFTIIPNPSDAIVHITAAGYIQHNNSITVPPGTIINWEVSKEGMESKSGRKAVNKTENYPVELKKIIVFTVAPSPSNATVELTAPGYTQEGNSITICSGTRVHWKVYKSGYIPKSNYIVVNDDDTLPVSLDPAATLTIIPTPSDAIVTITSEGYGQYGNKITVPVNTQVYWSVVKPGYRGEYGDPILTNDVTIPVNLTPL